MKVSPGVLDALNVLRCCIIDCNDKFVMCVDALNKDRAYSSKDKSTKVALKTVFGDDDEDSMAKKKASAKNLDLGSDSDSDADFRPPPKKTVKPKKVLSKNVDMQPTASDDAVPVAGKDVASDQEMKTASDEDSSPETCKDGKKGKQVAPIAKEVGSDNEVENESDKQPKKKDKRKRSSKARGSGKGKEEATRDKKECADVARKSSDGGGGGSSYKDSKVVGSDNEVESENEDTVHKLKRSKSNVGRTVSFNVNEEPSKKKPLGLPIHVPTPAKGNVFPPESDSEISEEETVLDVD